MSGDWESLRLSAPSQFEPCCRPQISIGSDRKVDRAGMEAFQESREEPREWYLALNLFRLLPSQVVRSGRTNPNSQFQTPKLSFDGEEPPLTGLSCFCHDLLLIVFLSLTISDRFGNPCFPGSPQTSSTHPRHIRKSTPRDWFKKRLVVETPLGLGIPTC